jgi:hypothetical protein
MGKLIHLRTLFLLFVGIVANAQTIVWTGAASDNNFFTEGNWKDSVTNVIPSAGEINPGTNISLALQINIPATIAAGGSIQFSTGSLALGSATVSATSLSGGNVTINQDGYLNLSAASPFLNNVQINFTSGIGWVRTTNYNPSSVSANNLGQIKVNSAASVYQTNLRLDNYYLNGCVIRANLSSATPLTVYDGINSLGNSALITVNTIHSGSAIAGSMNNKIKSFVLKKGFMATFAIEEDGTGKSKNYIASETDLVINMLPVALRNSISFVRVMPWNWVNKRGRTDDGISPGTDLTSTWRYRWSSTHNSTLDWEYAPMAWGSGGADDAGDIALYVSKYNSTHIMSFNESDACKGQSGQYPSGPTQFKLCNPDVAVTYHKNLMKTGMRIVSPGCREEAPFGWLEDFNNKCAAQDVRIDVIAVHWYDWGAVLDSNTSNDTGLSAFNRFKAYLTNVYTLYGFPIWITEFNANPARSAAVNLDFMNLALPYLESLSYVERYNWFADSDGIDSNSLYVGTTTTLTTLGAAYINQVSTKSIPGNTVDANNNLTLGTCLNCN